MGLRCTKRSRASCSQNSAQRADINFFAKIFFDRLADFGEKEGLLSITQ